MRQWCEIARCSYTAPTGNPWQNTMLLQIKELLECLFGNTGITQAERVNFKLKHQPGNIGRYRVTHSTGVTQQDVFLQYGQVITGYAFVGQNTKTGIDAIVCVPIKQGVIDNFARISDRVRLLP